MSTITHFCRERRWQILATFLCFLFGIAFILNVHPIGDGLWFWYAVLVRGGQRLYADMHLPLQPLFVLLTVWTQELFGLGWLASKALALAQLGAYCVALFLINGFLPWKDWQKAILIASVFGMTMGAYFFRFDDYHITCYCFEVYSIYLFLRLEEEVRLQRFVPTVALLGVLSGLSTANRLNDGGALFAACGFVLLFFIRSRKILALCVFCVAAALALFGIVALTGDSVHAWALNSIIRAAAIKGGAGHVLFAPLLVPLTVGKFFFTTGPLWTNLAYAGFVAAICILVQCFGRRPDGRWWTGRVAVAVAILLLTLPRFISHSFREELPEAIATLGTLVFFALSALILVRLVRTLVASTPRNWHRRELLLLIPFSQLVAEATSSGTSVLWTYPSVAVFLLLLPVSWPICFRIKWQKTAYVAVAGLIAISAMVAKAYHPYYWHHFDDRTFFVDRQWYHHPVYGPMYIERDQLQFVRSICADINRDGPPQELLSITNPYLNYFCNVVPWHGYVQTWYDTTSPQTIARLIGELQTAPPQWIIYQRGLDTMRLHELVLMDGHPLPHRALDRMMMDRIADHKWTVVHREEFQGADWILIRTHP